MSRTRFPRERDVLLVGSCIPPSAKARPMSILLRSAKVRFPINALGGREDSVAGSSATGAANAPAKKLREQEANYAERSEGHRSWPGDGTGCRRGIGAGTGTEKRRHCECRDSTGATGADRGPLAERPDPDGRRQHL